MVTISKFTLHCAHDFMSRLRGLHGIDQLRGDAGLWLRPCNAVHTFGMGYDIDVVFLDKQHRVLKHVGKLRPNRAACCLAARSVVELPGGYCMRNGNYAQVLRQAILVSG